MLRIDWIQSVTLAHTYRFLVLTDEVPAREQACASIALPELYPAHPNVLRPVALCCAGRIARRCCGGLSKRMRNIGAAPRNLRARTLPWLLANLQIRILIQLTGHHAEGGWACQERLWTVRNEERRCCVNFQR
jgi:hypothetical protein